MKVHAAVERGRRPGAAERTRRQQALVHVWLHRYAGGHGSARARVRERRAWLRQVLASCAGCTPAELRFAIGVSGKPRCSAPARARCWRFNLSWSGEIVALAVSMAGEVGIDIERRRPRDFRAVSRAWFSGHERRWLGALTEADSTSGFYRVWCRKEAFAKALGVGIDGSFADFSVVQLPRRLPASAKATAARRGSPPKRTAQPALFASGRDATRLGEGGKPARYWTPGRGGADRVLDDRGRARSDWRLWDLDLPGGYTGALATPSQIEHVEVVRCR